MARLWPGLVACLPRVRAGGPLRASVSAIVRIRGTACAGTGSACLCTCLCIVCAQESAVLVSRGMERHWDTFVF